MQLQNGFTFLHGHMTLVSNVTNFLFLFFLLLCNVSCGFSLGCVSLCLLDLSLLFFSLFFPVVPSSQSSTISGFGQDKSAHDACYMPLVMQRCPTCSNSPLIIKLAVYSHCTCTLQMDTKTKWRVMAEQPIKTSLLGLAPACRVCYVTVPALAVPLSSLTLSCER